MHVLMMNSTKSILNTEAPMRDIGSSEMTPNNGIWCLRPFFYPSRSFSCYSSSLFFLSVASILFKINLDYFMFPSITRWTLIHSVLSMVQSRFVKTGCINCILAALLGSCFYDLIITFKQYSGKSILVLTSYFFFLFCLNIEQKFV